MELIDGTVGSPEEDLALDIALLRRLDRMAEDGQGCVEALRFWSCERPVVVMGRSACAAEDIDLSSCREAGVPVLRRSSGGGTVVLAPGCLNFSLVLGYASRPALRNVAESYSVILGRTAAGLRVPGLVRHGVSDLAWRGRKVSGNAQLRGRHGLVHHGTLLHAFDAGLPSRFLHEPRRQPRYRARRVHADFIGNLPLSEKVLMARLAAAWKAQPGPATLRSGNAY